MTPIQKYPNDQKKSGKNILDLDTFGEIMDDFIRDNEVKMLITMPKGSNIPQIMDNMGIGAVGKLFFLIAAIPPVFRELLKTLDREELPTEEVKKLADGILDLVRDEMIGE